MKKIIFLLLLLITLILCGCNKKIKIQVNEYNGGIYLEDEHSNWKNDDRFYEVMGETGCYLFKDYNDFDNFINENNLLMEKEIESKYSQDFFLDKSMILYFGIDSSGGYNYKFNLYNNKDNILNFEIDKSINDRYGHAGVICNRMFFIDINKKDIMGTTEFVFSTNIKHKKL